MTKIFGSLIQWFGSDNRKASGPMVGISALIITFAVCGGARGQPTNIPRIGYLTAPAFAALTAEHEAFYQGLRELGYVEGKNIIIERRSAEAKLDRLPELAAELVRLKVDIIVTAGPAPPAPLREPLRRFPLSWHSIMIPLATGLLPVWRGLAETLPDRRPLLRS